MAYTYHMTKQLRRKDIPNVKTIRDKLRLTQEELAQRLGVSVITISRWERGEFSPSKLARLQLDRLMQEESMAQQKPARP